MKSALLPLLLLATTLTFALCHTASSQPATPSPAVYHGRVEVEVRPPKDEDAVQFVRKYLPEDTAITVTQLRVTPTSVTIEIGFKHSDQKVAARRAWELTKALPANLKDVYGLPVFGFSKYQKPAE